MAAAKKIEGALLSMRLRRVTMDVDFRSSEVSMVRDLTLAGEMPAHLGARDVLCFVSRSRRQVVFVWRPVVWEDREATAVCSMRWRMTGDSEWDPLMLANYARAVGIELEGIKTFDEHFAYLGEEVRAAAKLAS